jgi:hypothetical protein
MSALIKARPAWACALLVHRYERGTGTVSSRGHGGRADYVNGVAEHVLGKICVITQLVH